MAGKPIRGSRSGESASGKKRFHPLTPVHEAEKLLVGLLGAFVCFLPWSVGATLIWSQATALLLAMFTMVVALLPRSGNAAASLTESLAFRLLTFPLFWIGLLFNGLLAAQVFNTGWTIGGTEGLRLMEPADPLPGFPVGVEAGLFREGPVQALIMGTAIWLALSAAWVGLTRRKAVHTLFWILTANTLGLVLVTFFQHYSRPPVILWFYEAATPNFLGPFPVHSHGAAYFLLAIGVALGMAGHHFKNPRHAHKRSTPTGFFVFTALFALLLLFFSFSTFAAVAAAVLIAYFAASILHREFFASGAGPRVFTGRLIIALSMVLAGFLSHTIVTAGQERLGGGRDIDAHIADRTEWETGVRAGWTMFRERPAFGFGAGGWTYFSEQYAGAEIDNAVLPAHPNAEHAGSEWTRLPAETGAAGTVLVLAGLAFLLFHTARPRVWKTQFLLFPLLGVLAVFLQSGVDLIFRTPAVLATWLMVWVLTAALARIDRTLRD